MTISPSKWTSFRPSDKLETRIQAAGKIKNLQLVLLGCGLLSKAFGHGPVDQATRREESISRSVVFLAPGNICTRRSIRGVFSIGE